MIKDNRGEYLRSACGDFLIHSKYGYHLYRKRDGYYCGYMGTFETVEEARMIVDE